MDGMSSEGQRETTYADVLDAYRDLEQRRSRRLVVLGEPGAGKSFSLERIAIEYAERALNDQEAPIPLLVGLGLWINPDEHIQTFVEAQLGELGKYFDSLRDGRRALLLLDGLNEIPAGQRKRKAEEVQRLVEDERLAGIVVTCREKDFALDFQLPFDSLTLQPLKPAQIRAFLHRAMVHERGSEDGPGLGEARFWEIAGGISVEAVWKAWKRAGATFDLFWTAADVPRENPNVRQYTSVEQDEIWRRARFDPRALIRLASNPYLLMVMLVLPTIPSNRAQLFAGFIEVLYERERVAREKRHDARSVPELALWEAALVELAETLQRKEQAQDAGGTRIALSQEDWPVSLTTGVIDFSVDANILEIGNNALRFTHQLLQEYLASRLLIEVSRLRTRAASDFWPAAKWWERTGWEVVAEIAAEACGSDADTVRELIAW
jgi:predicted NACHT family NTPase